MKSYAEYMASITSKENAARVALEQAIDAACAKAEAEGNTRFTVNIPPGTSREVVAAVSEHYQNPPFNWPVRVNYDQRDGNAMYFGRG